MRVVKKKKKSFSNLTHIHTHPHKCSQIDKENGPVTGQTAADCSKEF